MEHQQIGKGWHVNLGLFGSKACIYIHYTILPQRNFGPPKVRLQKSGSSFSQDGNVRGPATTCFFFLSGHIALCCCSLEVGRQGDSRELWKGRMDEKVFQRRSLCPPLILWASSGKQRPQYVNLTAFRYTCPHACVHTGSAAVRASRLKIRKSFPEQLLA